MHFKGIDLNLLVVLDALLEEESVSKAALRLNVSQPAVSAALAKLRWHTGDELLEKIGRTLRPTPRALEMVKPLKEILIEVETLVKGDKEFDPATFDRDFAISMTSYGAQVVLPNFMERLQIAAPHVKCSVEDIAFDTITRIKSGELDYAITFLQTRLLNPREDLDELSHAHLFSDRWVLVGCAENEALAEGIDFDTFRSLPYIEVKPGGIPSLVEHTLDQIANRPRPTLSVPSFGLALRNVIATNCVTIVPSLMVDSLIRPLVKVIESPFKVPEIDEFLVWHSRNDDLAGHKFVRSVMLESVQPFHKSRPSPSKTGDRPDPQPDMSEALKPSEPVGAK